MKILWVVNKYCGAYHEEVLGKKSTGGLWLDAMIDQAKDFDDEIVIVNINANPKHHCFRDGKITYYTVKGILGAKYNPYHPDVLKQWEEIIISEKPEIVMFWGTEFPYALSVIKVAEGIPFIVYAQGILDSIGKYYSVGFTKDEIKYACTLRDTLTKTSINKMRESFEKRAEYEAEIIQKCKHVILENKWSEAYFRKIEKDFIPHTVPISISKTFKETEWLEEGFAKHTIMCPAADYPVKGLHMLLKALEIVKIKYPDVKLYIPGAKLKKPDSIISKLKFDGYSKLITRLIEEKKLHDNIEYTGNLTAIEMAERMASVNCFVMCSAIENHSSTLKEAMTVGTPSIASFVGGVSEYAINEENALLYRYEDYEVLANDIVRLFENAQLRKKLSESAKKSMRESDGKESDYQKIRKVYEEVLIKKT